MTSTIGGVTGTTWVYPTHQHSAHVHALAYCEPCDAAFCTGCNRQWGGRAAYTVTNSQWWEPNNQQWVPPIPVTSNAHGGS